jgi:hypothetical protein
LGEKPKPAAPNPVTGLAVPDQWRRLPDTVYGLIGMLSKAGSMRHEEIAILSDALGICRELLLRRPAEYGGPRECR